MPYNPPQSPRARVLSHSMDLNRSLCHFGHVGQPFGTPTSLTQDSLSPTRYASHKCPTTLAPSVKSASTLNRKSNEIQYSPPQAGNSRRVDMEESSIPTCVSEQEQESHVLLRAEDGTRFNQPLASATQAQLGYQRIVVNVFPVDDVEQVEHDKWQVPRDLRKTTHNRSTTTSSSCIALYDTHSQNTAPNRSTQHFRDKGRQETTRPILKKRSADLVRPPSENSKSVRPSTSTCPKAVRFDSHLEHVRFFLQVDKPLAVSADPLWLEPDNSKAEVLLSDDGSSKDQTSPSKWELVLPNFPIESLPRLLLPVRVERVSILSCSMELVGYVAVSNLAFSKVVMARYTLDNWNTFSDIVAEFSTDFHEANSDGYDFFKFNIKLADEANLGTKTLRFCVKYSVNGQEYWDNNNSENFQVGFRKKVAEPLMGQEDEQKVLTRSRDRISEGRKKSALPISRGLESIPTAFKHFAHRCNATDGAKFKQLVNDCLSKRRPSSGGQGSLSRLTPSPNGRPFGNRYNFDASLYAEMRSSNNYMHHRGGVRTNHLLDTNTALLGNAIKPWDSRNSASRSWDTTAQANSPSRGLVLVY